VRFTGRTNREGLERRNCRGNVRFRLR
jgi:hypothetical protein